MNNRPKRRKSNDNPYTLQIINNTYVVIFKDGSRKEQVIEVSEEVFNQMDKFELEDISQMHKIDKHIERFELSEESINVRSINNSIDTTSDFVEKKIINEELRDAISSLPEFQKRRIIKYYFYNKTFEEIAKEEQCSKVAIKYSIDSAIKNISKKIKN